jgi:hypothetical protein
MRLNNKLLTDNKAYRHKTSPLPHTYQYLDTGLQSVHHNICSTPNMLYYRKIEMTYLMQKWKYCS